MADAQSVVELVFQGVDRTGEATQAALNNAQKFSQSVQNVAAPIADATEKAIKLELAIIAVGAAITTFAIKAAGDFDSSFREITTLIDEPVESLADFRQAILDYARDSSAGLEEITSAVYSAISAGVDYTDSLDVVAKAEQLAIAGKASLKESIIALEGPLNAYGASAEEAGDFSDALFQAVRDGITTLPELSNSLSRVTGLAANAGIEFGELLAAVSALTATGTPTAEAVTQIRAAISNIISPSQQAANFAAELGLEFNAAALETRGFAGVLQDAADATGGNIDELAKLFGSVQALGGVLTLTGVAAESFADALEGQANRAGATAEAYERMAGSIEQSNQNLANALRTLLIEIGTPLLDEYGSVTRAIAAIFNALGVSVREGELGGLVEFVESIMADIAAALEDVARNLPAALEQADLSGFQRNLEAVLEGVQRLFRGVDITTEEGLVALIEGVGAGFARLGEFVGAAIAALGPLVDAFLKIAETIVGLDEKWFRLAGTVGGFAIIIDKVLGPALDALLLILVAKSIGGSAGGVAGALGGLATKVGALLPVLGQAGLVTAAGAAGYAVGTVLADGIDRVVDRFTGSGSLGGLIYDLINGTEDWTTATVNVARAQGVLADETDKTSSSVKEVVKDYDALVGEATLAADINDELAASFRQIGLEWDATTGTFRAGVQDLERNARMTERLGETYTEAGRTFEFAQDEAGRFYQRLVEVDQVQEQAAVSAKEAFEQTDAYFLKLMELQSNERIRLIEIKAELDVADIEAQTRRVESAFESLNVGIESTGNTITELFGLLTQSDSFFDRIDLRRAIERETKFREQEFALQRELIETQIDNLRAKTAALDRGDALIQIDGAGLQPHLEAFMWEILRTIQTRVNEDGMEMLLGAT